METAARKPAPSSTSTSMPWATGLNGATFLTLATPIWRKSPRSTNSSRNVSRFLVLHKELDADDGELTRTNKVRRGFIADRYSVLIDALYAGKTEQFIDTQVKFEDGRTGSVSATLKISDTKTFTPVKAAA